MDLQALLDAKDRLPKDFLAGADPVLRKIQLALQNEGDLRSWYAEISDLFFQVDLAIYRVAAERTERNHPKLAKILISDLAIEESALFKADILDLRNEITTAKYKHHPNWKRVEKNFQVAKTDVQNVIAKLKIPNKKRSEFKKAIDAVTLQLPLGDPRSSTGTKACSNHEVNAFYSSWFKNITVCAGFFNTFAADAVIYSVLTHELAHAIDPNEIAKTEFLQKNDFSLRLKKVIQTSSKQPPDAHCLKEWAGLEKTSELVLKDPPKPKESSLQKFYDCLEPKEHLVTFTQEAFLKSAERMTRQTISQYASISSFLTLGQPNLTKKSQLKENEFFLRPDRLMASYEDDVFVNTKHRNVSPLDIFSSLLRCSGKKTDPKVFHETLLRTQKLAEALKIHELAECGRNCSDLVLDGLSMDSAENFADWISMRAFNLYLARLPTKTERQSQGLLSRAHYCEYPGVRKDAPELALIERKFSLQPHSDSRRRRISGFNDTTADLMGCELDITQENFGLCEPDISPN